MVACEGVLWGKSWDLVGGEGVEGSCGGGIVVDHNEECGVYFGEGGRQYGCRVPWPVINRHGKVGFICDGGGGEAVGREVEVTGLLDVAEEEGVYGIRCLSFGVRRCGGGVDAVPDTEGRHRRVGSGVPACEQV